MTTKVLIVNHGPDPVLVRTVDYSEAHAKAGHEALVLKDELLQPTESLVCWVSQDQQLMVGEKRG